VRIVITPRAFDDLAATAGYVSQDNPAAAGRLVDRVFEVIDLLAEGGLDGPLTTLRSGVEVRQSVQDTAEILAARSAQPVHAGPAAANPRNRATSTTPTYTSNPRHRGGYQLGTKPG
jgi:plasmid stabilization system protein ParE